MRKDQRERIVRMLRQEKRLAMQNIRSYERTGCEDDGYEMAKQKVEDLDEALSEIETPRE
jgi:predicted translin family RNA/ssDNA-binding protein